MIQQQKRLLFDKSKTVHTINQQQITTKVSGLKKEGKQKKYIKLMYIVGASKWT